MARQSNEQAEIKTKTVFEAFDTLVDESSPSKDRVTFENIHELTNSLLILSGYKGDLSISTLKQSKATTYKKLRKKIKEHKNNQKIIKNSTSSRIKSKIDDLEEKLHSDLETISILLDNEVKLKKIIETLKKSRDEARNERNDFAERLSNME